MKLGANKLDAYLIMVLPLFFILMPRPDVAGIQFMLYPAIGVICIFALVIMARVIEFDKRVIAICSIVFTYSGSISLAAIFNNGSVGYDVFIHIFKPILFILILLLGYIIGTRNNITDIGKGLLKASYIILIVQIVVGVTQLYGLHFFDFVYSSEKTRPLGHIVRIAGTLANPNIFAWIVIQMVMIIFVFEEKKFKKSLFVLIGIGLVFLSGSRSLLVLFPVMILIAKLFIEKKNLKYFFFKIPLYLIILSSFMLVAFWFIDKYKNTFPYIYQILSIFDSGNLTNVHSFEARTFMWENAIEQIQSKDSITSWLFGIGPGSITVLDNDYLYLIVNYGIISLIISLILYISLFFQFSKLRNKKIAAVGKVYIIFSFILGYQADALGGWNYPILIMFYVGIAIAIRGKQNFTEHSEEVKEKSKARRKHYKIVW